MVNVQRLQSFLVKVCFLGNLMQVHLVFFSVQVVYQWTVMIIFLLQMNNIDPSEFYTGKKENWKFFKLNGLMIVSELHLMLSVIQKGMCLYVAKDGFWFFHHLER